MSMERRLNKSIGNGDSIRFMGPAFLDYPTCFSPADNSLYTTKIDTKLLISQRIAAKRRKSELHLYYFKVGRGGLPIPAPTFILRLSLLQGRKGAHVVI